MVLMPAASVRFPLPGFLDVRDGVAGAHFPITLGVLVAASAEGVGAKDQSCGVEAAEIGAWQTGGKSFSGRQGHASAGTGRKDRLHGNFPATTLATNRCCRSGPARASCCPTGRCGPAWGRSGRRRAPGVRYEARRRGSRPAGWRAAPPSSGPAPGAAETLADRRAPAIPRPAYCACSTIRLFIVGRLSHVIVNVSRGVRATCSCFFSIPPSSQRYVTLTGRNPAFGIA